MRLHTLAAASVTAVAAALLATLVVAAHAELISTDPPADGTLTETPYTISLTFDEDINIERSSVVVRDESGAEVARGGVSDQMASVMTADLPAVPDGSYSVVWTAVTDNDGAVERGSFSFSVRQAGPPAQPTSAPSPAATPAPGPAAPTAGGSDLLIALVVAGVVIGAVIAFVVLRNRR